MSEKSATHSATEFNESFGPFSTDDSSSYKNRELSLPFLPSPCLHRQIRQVQAHRFANRLPVQNVTLYWYPVLCTFLHGGPILESFTRPYVQSICASVHQRITSVEALAWCGMAKLALA